jgi:hypothetical protein
VETWETYEEVAVYILDQIASNLELDLERVEGKQHVYGSRSSTNWEIDGKGVKVDGEGFVIIECRRYTASKQNQERVAALAYRIIDTGASGGILVSARLPRGCQEGRRRRGHSRDLHGCRKHMHRLCTEVPQSSFRGHIAHRDVHSDCNCGSNSGRW